MSNMNVGSGRGQSNPGQPGQGQGLPSCPSWGRRMLAAVLVCSLSSLQVWAQLAITEAMSYASTNCPGCPETGSRGCHPDFWELTNFGTNTYDLSDYLFADGGALFPDGAWFLPWGLLIQPNESIIFVREGWTNEVPDAAGFRRWWGESNLPSNLQIIFYPGHYGFDDKGDAVRLWDANSNVVDQIYFGTTRRGVTFTYDPNTGEVMQSELGVCGAFPAAICGDVGSPGYAPCGPVPLRITQQPVSQAVDPGSDVTFSVRASGVPMPRGYQWYFNGALLPNTTTVADSIPRVVNYAGCGVGWTATPRATDLTISNAQPAHAGQYFVVLTNGLERLTSAVVRLTVNTNPVAPRIECPPAALLFPRSGGNPQTNLVVAPWQTATFTVLARGYPLPRFQWSWSMDGAKFVNLPNATNATLEIPWVQSSHAGTYRVCVTNRMGAITNFAWLAVKPEPQFKITEVMSDECFPDANDWWELTNVGDEPVDLYGFRWDDGPGNIGGGPTITNTVMVQPGESVIFLEGRTPEFFINWWGASNLPTGLQFIYYTANGFESDGDSIRIWNPTATDDSDKVDSVGFSTARTGASFWFAPNDLCSEFGPPSVEGQCGAFRSAQGCDVGSPGWTSWTPPRLTSIRREDVGVRLEWKAQPGSTSLIQWTSQFSHHGTNVWMNLGTYSFDGATCTAVDTNPGGDSQRFYRVNMVAPAGCPCSSAITGRER